MLLGAARAVLTQMGADFKPFERHLDEATEARSLGRCSALPATKPRWSAERR